MSTYTPIASQTLTSAVSSVTFTGIPQNFTDLIIIANVQGQSNGCNIEIWFNGDGSSSNYSTTTIYYSGTSALSTRNSNTARLNFGTNGGQPFANANQFATNIYNIQNYANTTTYKTTLGTTRSPDGGYTGAGELDQSVGLWRNVNAITSVSIGVDNGKTMQIGSTFNLYGIASGSAKATGGIVTTDGTYFYHTFTSSGVFTPSANLTADVLSIGGGGAGGRGGGGGGGGGAGELDLFSSQSLTAQAYPITIGAGGSASSPYSPTNGGTTSFSNLITSLGGGCGASGSQAAGNGGSGGGGGNDIPTAGTASGSNTFAGGAGYTGGAPYNGGGGGGATAVGAAGTSGGGGNGGAGYALSSISAYMPTLFSPMTVVSSGGGGAVQNGTGQNTQPGTGGTGAGNGGGSGSSYTGPVNATAASSYGSGGGGSAGSNAGNPSSGFQGVVVVRYAV